MTLRRLQKWTATNAEIPHSALQHLQAFSASWRIAPSTTSRSYCIPERPGVLLTAYRGLFPDWVATPHHCNECPSCPFTQRPDDSRRNRSQPNVEAELQGLLHPNGPTPYDDAVTHAVWPTPLLTFTLSEVNSPAALAQCFQ